MYRYIALGEQNNIGLRAQQVAQRSGNVEADEC